MWLEFWRPKRKSEVSFLWNNEDTYFKIEIQIWGAPLEGIGMDIFMKPGQFDDFIGETTKRELAQYIVEDASVRSLGEMHKKLGDLSLVLNFQRTFLCIFSVLLHSWRKKLRKRLVNERAVCKVCPSENYEKNLLRLSDIYPSPDASKVTPGLFYNYVRVTVANAFVHNIGDTGTGRRRWVFTDRGEPPSRGGVCHWPWNGPCIWPPKCLLWLHWEKERLRNIFCHSLTKWQVL